MKQRKTENNLEKLLLESFMLKTFHLVNHPTNYLKLSFKQVAMIAVVFSPSSRYHLIIFEVMTLQ